MRRAWRISLAIIALAAALAPAAAAAEARRAMAEGLRHVAAGNYEQAARSFEEAASGAAGEGLDPAIALYDLGCALLKAGKGPEAAAAFAEASRSPDRALGAKAHYNRGIALVVAAEAAETTGRLEGALALIDQALESYESAMRAEPEDEDPKVNHELAFRKKAQLEEKLREQARQQDRGGQPPPPAQRGAEERTPGSPQGRPKASGKEMNPDEARTMLDAMKQQEVSQRSRISPPRGDSAPVDKPW